MKKKYHKLKENKRTSLPVHLIFYDTESYQEKKDTLFLHKLRLGWACYVNVRYKNGEIKTYEKWFKFTDKTEFWNWVMGLVRDKSKLYLIAHNQNFDFIILDGFRELPLRGYMITKWAIDSNVFIVHFKRPENSIVVLDSLNIFKSSIEQLGEVLGLPKLKIDFERCTDDELSEYCKRDVEILKETFINWLKFIKEHDLGNFQYTLASQAFGAYRHRFMKKDIFIHAHPKAISLERESYRGGRTEAFRLGYIDETVYYLDVNSLYPFVMKEFEYPIKLVKLGERLSRKGLKRFLDKYCVIARVKVNTHENVFGVKHERLIFPIGEFECVLCTEELKYGLDYGYIQEIYDYAVYEKADIFSSYVDFFNSLKEKYSKEGNKVMRNMAKLLLNSLYGKFGQRNEIWKPAGEDVIDEYFVSKYVNAETGESGLLYQFAGRQFIKYKGEEEAFNSFVAIASEVTANARMHLWKLMKKAGLENVYYVDTDSLFVNLDGYENLKDELHDYRLGKLKLEGVSEGMLIRNVKDYVFNGKVKLKGVKKNSKQISENEYLTERFYKFRTLLRKGYLDCPVHEQFIKRLKREYKKGVVLPNGKVLPFRFPL